MNSGFANLRASLPMNLKAHYPKHRVWGGAKPDIERIVEIWTDCLATYGGPFLFGKQRGMADAMYAPVVTRFLTYDVAARRRLRGATATRSWRCRRCASGSPPPRPSPTTSPSSTWSSERRLGQAAFASAGHGVGSGTSAGAGMSTVVKSAGPTTSRYSMSGE